MNGCRRRCRVGILELLKESPGQHAFERVYDTCFRKQFSSVMPQAVAAWCRQLGHRVFYATYYGQQDPKTLLPDDLDVVIVGAFTRASALAYALAKRFRRDGAMTVIGGPHAKSFPDDCLRFFDFAIGECDKTLIDELLQGRFDPPARLSSRRPLTDIPGVEERIHEISTAAFYRGRPRRNTQVPLLSSIGCPYTCDFCVDWNTSYVRLPSERLQADLEYLSARWPWVFVAYHDPNFGVQFDRTLEVIESIPESRRNPYGMESSLSVLKPDRLERLRRSNCLYVAPGVESWADYSNKTGTGARRGREKLERVVEHFSLLWRHFEGLQANFVFGTHADSGREPVELTREFIRRTPRVWPGLNIPVPIGGTPLFEKYLTEGRILRSMPFAFYFLPYLTIVPVNYHPKAYYDHIIEIFEEITSPRMWMKRLTNGAHPVIRFIHALQAWAAHQELAGLRHLRRRLDTDDEVLAFHEGRTQTLPAFYHHEFERRLGSYAQLLTRDERIPLCAL